VGDQKHQVSVDETDELPTFLSIDCPVLLQNAVRVGKGADCCLERNPMLAAVGLILRRVPLESGWKTEMLLREQLGRRCGDGNIVLDLRNISWLLESGEC
jgi:hypothetical protein